MTYYLFLWNPNKDPGYTDDVEAFRTGTQTVFRWSCGNATGIKPGDRAILRRTGAGAKGIIGIGEIVTDVSVGPPRTEGGAGKSVGITWEQLALDPIVAADDTEVTGIKDIWTAQAGGTQLTDADGALVFERVRDAAYWSFVPSVDRLVAHWRRHPPSEKQRQMLATHYWSLERDMHPQVMADAMGWPNQASAHLHYGRLAGDTASAMGVELRSGSDNIALFTGITGTAGDVRWRMHDSVQKAVEVMGWHREFQASLPSRPKKVAATSSTSLRIGDLMAPDGRVFLKSEWGPISDDWPCLSFTKKSVGDRLRREFVPGRDVLVYVGTTDPETTPEVEHRSCLLSALVIEPKQDLETRKIVPAHVWERSVEEYGDRWPRAMPVIKAAQVVGPPYPPAREVIPLAYRSFSDIANRGNVVEVGGDERSAVMGLDVRTIELRLAPEVESYIGLRASTSVDKEIAQQAYRMAELIRNRVKAGGELTVRINPQRTAANVSDLVLLFQKKWLIDQKGKCALCGGGLVTSWTNELLKPSADRIDSSNGAYVADNVQIAHYACNLAKNQWGLDAFVDWLAVTRRT